MKLYASAIMAQKQGVGFITMSSTSLGIRAHNEDEAVGIATRYGRERFKSEDNYGNPVVSVTEIPFDWCVDIVQDYLKERDDGTIHN